MIAITIKDSADPQLAELSKDFENIAPMMTASGRGVSNLLRDHFAELDATRPNKMGWERQHFWNDVRGTVQNPIVNGNRATVDINHVALRQKIEGGPIAPGAGKQFLTLPAQDEAYGKRAREFSDLKFAMAEDPSTGRMRPALVAQRGVATFIQQSNRGKKLFKAVAEQIGVVAIFWLVRRVMQAAFPGAMPTDGQLSDAAYAGAREWAAARLAQLKLT